MYSRCCTIVQSCYYNHVITTVYTVCTHTKVFAPAQSTFLISLKFNKSDLKIHHRTFSLCHKLLFSVHSHNIPITTVTLVYVQDLLIKVNTKVQCIVCRLVTGTRTRTYLQKCHRRPNWSEIISYACSIFYRP